MKCMHRPVMFIVIMFLQFGCTSTPKKSASDGAVNAKLEVVRQLITAGEYKNAILVGQGLTKLAPKQIELLNLLGLAYLGNQNFDAAARSFRHVLNLDDEHMDARLNLAYSLILVKKYLEARNELDIILEDGKYPFMERVQVNYGLSYFEEKRCDLAAQRFEAALQLDPLFAAAHFNLGKCAMLLRTYDQAVVHFKKAVDSCPGCTDPLLDLARAYKLAGRKKDAVASLESMMKRTDLDSQTRTRTQSLLDEFKH